MFETEKCFPRSDTALVLVLKQKVFFLLLLGDFGGGSAHVEVLGEGAFGALSRCSLQGIASGQELLEAGFVAVAGTEHW